jgi:hypothetical protein
LNTWFILTIIGLLICASASHAQVTAVARITLTVIPGSGIDFSPASSARNSLAVNRPSKGGFTSHVSSNVRVMLDISGLKRMLDNENLSQGMTEILTSEKLIGVSKVEVVYLGS